MEQGVGSLAKILESTRCLDVVARDGFAGLDVAGKHRIDAFAQQRFRELPVGPGLALHEFLEAFRLPWVCSAQRTFRFVVLPTGLGILDAALLTSWSRPSPPKVRSPRR